MTNVSSLREDQARAVRSRLVDAAISIVESGQEPNMRAVANAATVSERTIYRYFATREDLFEAVLPILRMRAAVPMAEDVTGLENYARDLFTVFDANRRLVRALVSSSWAAPMFERSRANNLKALQAVLDGGFPSAPRADRRSAAAALRVPISGAGWVYLSDCGLSLKQSVNHARWIIRTVLQKLEQVSGDTENA